MKRLIFVYGTLRPKHEGAFKQYLEGKCAVLGECRVPGVMYDHGYPACVFENLHANVVVDSTVLGDVLELEPDGADEVMRALDWYEGYPTNYGRVEVETPYGVATAYQIVHPHTDRPIPDGDWIKHHNG